MHLLRGILGGSMAGAMGAALWAFFAYLLHVESKWIAIAVGAMVGTGVARASRDGGRSPGLVAVGIAVLALLVGKYAAVHLSTHDALQPGAARSAVDVAMQDRDVLVAMVADELLLERGQSRRSAGPDDDALRSTYPPRIWADAQARWDAMSPGERHHVREAARARAEAERAVLARAPEQATARAFRQSFDAMDLLFFAIAIAVAFRLATRPRSA